MTKIKHKIVCIALSLMLASGLATTSLATVYSAEVSDNQVSKEIIKDGFEFRLKDNNTLCVEACGLNDENIVIPSFVDGYKVTDIGTNSFYSNNYKTITIPDTVTNISTEAFAHCRNLETVIGGKGIKTISFQAFSGCRLKNITFYDGLTQIDSLAFQYCPIESIELPDSVTSIGAEAFSGCDNLKTVSIGTGINIIEEQAFANCNSLAEVKIGGNNLCISKSAFESCNNLAKVEFTGTVESIMDGAFWGTKLNEINLPETLNTIGKGAFKNTKLKSVILPENVERIESNTFNGCGQLEKVELNENINYIGDYAFFKCPELKSIYIPKSVEEIGELAIGFTYDEEWEPVKTGITIYGYKGTAAEKYANMYKIKFIDLSAGDVDGNGTVDIDDVTIIQKYVSELTTLDETQLESADVNGDGNVDIDDATQIQKQIAK